MIHKQLRFTLLSLLLIVAFGVSACQEANRQPTGAGDGTKTTQPTVRSTRTQRPLPSVTPSPTHTQLPHLAVDESNLRNVQVDFWHPWRGDLARKVDEVVGQFNRENQWGIKVRVRALSSSTALNDAVETAWNGSPGADAPDVLAAAPEELGAWMQDEHLVALDDYIHHATWGLKPGEAAAFTPQFWMQDQFHNEQIGIAALRTGRVLFYNETWANELGFDREPRTPQEFRKQACAAAQDNNLDSDTSKHFTGGWLIDTNSLTLLSWLSAFGAQVLPTSDGAPYTFDTPAAADATKYLRDLFDDGCAWEGRSPIPYEYFANRMALFYSGTLQEMSVQADTQRRLNLGDRWRVIAYPTEDATGIVFSQGYSYGIVANEHEQQLASWLFIRWMSSGHNQALLAEVWPSFPVTSSAEQELVDYRKNFPWSMILPLQAVMQPAPVLPSWRSVRVILEDGAMLQLFRLPADQMITFLPQLDEISREILQQVPKER